MKDKKLIIISILILFFGVFLVACSNKNLSTNQESYSVKLKVASSIFPIYSIINEVGGDRIDNYLILPSGSSPHTYDASPQDIKSLQGVKVIFGVGAGADDWLDDLTYSISGVEKFTLDNQVNLQSFPDHEEENIDEDHYHGDVDPHYWLNPDNAISIAEAAALKFSELDPEGREEYLENFNDFKNKLSSLDIIWQAKLNQLNRKEIVVFHDAWNYFAKHYNLKIVASIEPFAGKSPGPRYLKDLQIIVKEKDIKAIFIEPQLATSVAEVLASDLNIEIATLDPLGGTESISDYFSLIEYNVDTIYNTLNNN